MSEKIDCIITGYKEDNVNDRLIIARTNKSAQKELELQCVTYDGRKYFYLDFYSKLLNNENKVYSLHQIPPLAPVFLSSYLKNKDIEAIPLFSVDSNIDEFIDLLDKEPLSIAITTTFFTSPKPIIEIVNFIRNYNQNVKIIVGGPFIYHKYLNEVEEKFNQFLKLIGANYYIVDFKGEEALYKIIDNLKNKNVDKDVDNVIALNDNDIIYNNIIKTKDNKFISIDWNNLNEDIGDIVNVRTSTGCANKCSFCNHHIIAGKLCLSSIDSIRKELKQLDERHVSLVCFIDDALNIPKKRFKQICKVIIEEKFNFKWCCYLRVGDIDEEIVALMKKSGCIGVNLGLESGDNLILKNMNKRSSVEDYIKGIELLNKYNIVSFGNFIIGFPGESVDTIRNTINFIEDSKLTFYRVNLWYYDVSTPIYKRKMEFMLKGQGYNWSHQNMNADTAFDYIEKIFLDVKSVTWAPLDNFGFWGLMYLYSRGYDFSKIKRLVSLTNKIVKNQYFNIINCKDINNKYINDIKNVLKSM